MSKVCMDTRVVACKEIVATWRGVVSLSHLGHVGLVAHGSPVRTVRENEHARVRNCTDLSAK